MRRFVSIIILLVTCIPLCLWLFQSLKEQSQGPIIDPMLLPYVDEWKSTMTINDIDYSHFNNIKSISVKKNVGSFGLSNERLRTIVVDVEAVTAGPATLRNTVYHELGHYIFGFEHTEDKDIMYRNNLGEEYYKTEWTSIKGKYVTMILLQQFD